LASASWAVVERDASSVSDADATATACSPANATRSASSGARSVTESQPGADFGSSHGSGASPSDSATSRTASSCHPRYHSSTRPRTARSSPASGAGSLRRAPPSLARAARAADRFDARHVHALELVLEPVELLAKLIERIALIAG